MSARENAALILEIFAAIERRDAQRFQALCHPDVEFHWPPPLPPDWNAAWTPFQPTAAERRMDPRVVAAGDEEVVVLWRQRGAGLAGARFDGEVLALYRVREGKLARARMFFFDPEAAARFLADAGAVRHRQRYSPRTERCPLAGWANLSIPAMRDGASTEEQPVAEHLSKSGRLMAAVLEAERVLWR